MFLTGASAIVTITVPRGFPPVTTYYKLGYPGTATPAGRQWYPFVYNPQHGHPNGSAGEIKRDSDGNQFIYLHLQDGGVGDDDGLRNGIITDPACSGRL